MTIKRYAVIYHSTPHPHYDILETPIGAFVTHDDHTQALADGVNQASDRALQLADKLAGVEAELRRSFDRNVELRQEIIELKKRLSYLDTHEPNWTFAAQRQMKTIDALTTSRDEQLNEIHSLKERIRHDVYFSQVADAENASLRARIADIAAIASLKTL